MASIRPVASTQNMVIGIYAKNFPRIPGRVMSGINTTIVVETPAIIGIAYSRRANKIALRGS